MYPIFFSKMYSETDSQYIFVCVITLYLLWILFFAFRDALLSCFPGIHHLMCYFHVKQACQVKLRGKPMKEQKEVLHELDELHCTTSLEEYNNLYRHTFRKWSEKCSDFAYYFEQQWNSGTSFNQWKAFCCPLVLLQPTMHWSHSTPCSRGATQTTLDTRCHETYSRKNCVCKCKCH